MSNIGIALQFLADENGDAELLAARARVARENGFDYLMWSSMEARPQLIRKVEQESGVKVIALQCDQQNEASLAACRALSIPDLVVNAVPRESAGEDEVRTSMLISRHTKALSSEDTTLQACVDVGAVLLAGGDGPELVRRASGRAPLVLLHDVAGQSFALLGAGRLDWEQVFDAGEEAGAEWYVVGAGSVDFTDPSTLRAAYDFLVKNA